MLINPSIIGTILPIMDGSEGVDEIAKSVRDARKQAGITQRDLADLSGVSERTIRAIETGTGNPSMAAVIAAARVLGLRVEVR
ncbi:transcriptional regulator, y4mF family [Arthrobacter subterraneus]|uniref:Transcriptional regulator, y4mF family n=2 Tax=Arthrobacter TaxID=1663 RepID=A0A1G8GZU0_9MICC|nr:transcriptional regulator, y4mF family [Arthrobacter subterraneus]